MKERAIILFFLLCLLITGGARLPMRTIALRTPPYPFQPGEKIFYKMNYSIFTVGKAEIVFNPVIYNLKGKKCYKIDVNGRTAGAAQLVSTVNDNWGTLMDSARLLPIQSWRNLQEGNYRRREFVDFNQETKEINVRVLDNKTGRFKDPKIYTFKTAEMRDLVSGYLFLRVIDFNHLSVGDTIAVNGFLEDSFYNFRIMYEGIEKVETKLGYIRAYKLVPIMPDNKIFAGENSITAWVSADRLQIPIKIEARMFIGRAGCEITGMENTRYEPHYTKEE